MLHSVLLVEFPGKVVVVMTRLEVVGHWCSGWLMLHMVLLVVFPVKVVTVIILSLE